MSDIYSIIYIIDLDADELTPVTADEASEKQRPKKLGAREQLLRMVRWDAADAYLEMTEKFVDLKTLPQRMPDNSIVCEYYSKNYGWCRLRFFAMDREPEHPLKKAVFTIHHAKPANLYLVVEYDCGEGLHFAHVCPFLEGEHLDVGYCQTVEEIVFAFHVFFLN